MHGAPTRNWLALSPRHWKRHASKYYARIMHAWENSMHGNCARQYAWGSDQKWAGLVASALEMACFKILCADYAHVRKYYARGLRTALCTGLRPEIGWPCRPGTGNGMLQNIMRRLCTREKILCTGIVHGIMHGVHRTAQDKRRLE